MCAMSGSLASAAQLFEEPTVARLMEIADVHASTSDSVRLQIFVRRSGPRRRRGDRPRRSKRVVVPADHTDAARLSSIDSTIRCPAGAAAISYAAQETFGRAQGRRRWCRTFTIHQQKRRCN